MLNGIPIKLTKLDLWDKIKSAKIYKNPFKYKDKITSKYKNLILYKKRYKN